MERIEPAVSTELNAVGPLVNLGTAAQMVDQQNPEERPGTLDKAAVDLVVGLLFEKPINSFGEPSNARGARFR